MQPDARCGIIHLLEVTISHDSELQNAVLAELNWEPSVIAGHIGVIAKDGIVTLTGHVESYAQKHAAELSATRVRGVLAAANEIGVELPVNTSRSDEEIAVAVVERLDWDSAIPTGSIKAAVAEGWITLSGQVDRRYQSEAAAKNVDHLRSVTGVTNEITIKGVVNKANLSNDISMALNRSWFFDPDAIEVSVDGGVIRLSGTVRTPHERQVAANMAWSAPGVISVKNDITVI
jgi:osmotically-inducible protein OsmY